MKLYDPRLLHQWVFAVVSQNAREGAQPTYVTVTADSTESAEQQLHSQRLKNAYQHPMGKYDDMGRYCIYKPPIEGLLPGKFVVHPSANLEYKQNRF
jgi:hypothetical protein